MLQNVKVTGVTFFELLRENQQGVRLLLSQIRVKTASIKACFRYFFKFLFFTKWYIPSKIKKIFFCCIKKALFVLEIFKFLPFFPFLSTISGFKRTNGKGIIYDALNWPACICRCNFLNNSKTALYYIIRCGQELNKIHKFSWTCFVT